MNGWSLPDEPEEGSLPPFGDLVAGLGDVYDDVGEGLGDDVDEPGDALASARAGIMTVDRITIVLSVEVEVQPLASGDVRVLGSTPTQWTETTVMPVFHHLTMHIGQDREANSDGEE